MRWTLVQDVCVGDCVNWYGLRMMQTTVAGKFVVLSGRHAGQFRNLQPHVALLVDLSG